MWRLLNRISDTRLSLLVALMVSTGMLIIFLPVMLFSIYQIVFQGGNQFMQLEVGRSETILLHEIDNLDLALLDWASWDATYQYVQDQNPAYIDSNLPNSTFSNLKIDIFLVLNLSGEVIQAKFVDHHNQVETPLPFSVADLLENYPSILQPADLQTGQKGLVLINHQPMMLAARPILDSQGEGPARGTLVFFRQLDSHDLIDFSQLTMREIRVYGLDRLPNGVPLQPNAATVEDQIIVQTLNKDTTVGYMVLDDLNGQSVLVLEVKNPSILRTQGRITAEIISILFLMLALLLFGGVFFFSRSLIASRNASRRYLQRFQAVVQRSSEAILLVNPDGEIIEANPTSMALLNWIHDPEQLVNIKNLLTFQPELDASFLLESSQAGQAVEHQCLRHDGRSLVLELVASQISDGENLAFSLNIHDVTERKMLIEQLRHDALYDSLTGLGNRALLRDHLRHVNERKKRNPQLLFALISLSFDHFKKVNDSFGHHSGDQLLVETAQRLEQSIRATDTIVRYNPSETLSRIGEDEFVILLEDQQSIENIYKLIDRVAQVLRSPFHVNGTMVSLSPIFGLVVPEQPYDNPEDIHRDADIALYRARQGGGAQVVCFNPQMHENALRRIALENDLRQAIEQHEFVIYYQPIYNTIDEQIAGFEALVRWNSPQRGLVMPGEFIPIAEETGLIAPIGYMVLEEACQQIQAWRHAHLLGSEHIISVNLASQQIMNSDLVERVNAILDKTGFDPKHLWLEITESTMVEMTTPIWAQLNQLSELGIKIEIDDFGTGYSSLSYLHHLPVDGFKIDRSFIQDIQNGGQQIVKTLVELSHNLGLTTVAEGVETLAQHNYLKSVHCHFTQGYLFSKPLSATSVEALLQSRIEPTDFKPTFEQNPIIGS